MKVRRVCVRLRLRRDEMRVYFCIWFFKFFFFLFQNGKILESGTHAELMDKKGLYYNLVTSQTKERDGGEAETRCE